MLFLRQSTNSQAVLLGPFVDSADGVTAETGLTIANTDIRLSKNGGNLAAKNSGGGTHDELGWYTITLNSTDTDTVGRLQALCSMSGALPVWAEFWVIEEAVFDQLFAASAPGAATPTALATVDTVVDAIKAVTDALPDAGALSSLATASALATVDSVVDAIAAALAVVDGIVDSILADTNELQTDDTPAALAALDALIDAIKAVTDALPDAGALTSLATAAALATVDGVADAVKAVTDKLDDTLEDDSGTYRFTENALEQAPAGGGGGGGLDAAGVRAAIGMASANLDTQLATIDQNVDDIETAVALLGGGVAGAGAITWVIKIDDGTDPIEAAHVWVATDAGQSNVVAGSLITDSFGEATFFLDAGTYYVFVRKDGYNPVLAEEIEVA